MRLKPRDIDAIKTAAAETFGADAIVRLFGSRTRDDLRGGDIDLLIEVDDDQQSECKADEFRSALFRYIDEQKIDVVFLPRTGDVSAFARMVAPGAVPLP